jgi:hypothetical protein
VDRGAVSEHNVRKEMQGMTGSKLKVERKLVDIIWDQDKPRTALRSRGGGGFDADTKVQEPLPESDDQVEEQEEDPWFWTPVPIATREFSQRSTWDASFLKNTQGSPLAKISFSDEAEAHVQEGAALYSISRSNLPRCHHIHSHLAFSFSLS